MAIIPSRRTRITALSDFPAGPPFFEFASGKKRRGDNDDDDDASVYNIGTHGQGCFRFTIRRAFG